MLPSVREKGSVDFFMFGEFFRSISKIFCGLYRGLGRIYNTLSGTIHLIACYGRI